MPLAITPAHEASPTQLTASISEQDKSSHLSLIRSIRGVLQAPLNFSQNRINSRSAMEQSFSGLAPRYALPHQAVSGRNDPELASIMIEGGAHQQQVEHLSLLHTASMASAADQRRYRHSKPDKPMLLLSLLALGTTAGAGGLWYAWHGPHAGAATSTALRRNPPAPAATRPCDAAVTGLDDVIKPLPNDGPLIQALFSRHTMLSARKQRQASSPSLPRACNTNDLLNQCEQAHQQATKRGLRFTNLVLKVHNSYCRCPGKPFQDISTRPTNGCNKVDPLHLMFNWCRPTAAPVSRKPIDDFYWGNNVGILTGIDPSVL